MSWKNKKYTVESVLKGHPDKICDQISDGLLDAYLQYDKNAHTAIECLGINNNIIIAGEVCSSCNIPVEELCNMLYSNITGLASLNVVNMLRKQSSQLGHPINEGAAGDQGIMYGYACQSNYNFLPYGYWLVNLIAKRLDKYREKNMLFLPDGKVQLTVDNGLIKQLCINVQHSIDSNLEEIRHAIKNDILFDVVCKDIKVNEDEGFIIGGLENDTGLTGRKIIIDTYGGLAPHGGGSFSGKDCSKLDRSAAYMCRFVAKNIVANKLADECTISVAYEFGVEKPTMICVEVNGKYSEPITNFVKHVFDFRPMAIVERLNLKNIKYLPTATYGHFTNENYPWEQIINI